ncbi:MAG: phage minor capsid protein [Ruminococcus flavefaciens]|nr:phage minor capsid protein [Ruminococcus flavefaciens]
MLGFGDIAKIFEEIELRLIRSLKRNIGRHKQQERQEGFEWSSWQAEKLRNVNKFRRECSAIMNEYTDVIDSETRQLMEEQFREGVNGAEVPDSDVQPKFFGVDDNKVTKLIDDVVNLEKHAETAALRTMDDVYRQTVNKAQLAMSTGSVTLQQAIDMAVRDFLDKGINCIVYRNGRRVNIADYVRMALRTTSTRAKLQGEAAKIKAMGYDTILVSSYSMCSDTCLPWQGRPYIDDVFSYWDGDIEEQENGELWGKSNYCDKWFPLLSTAIHGGLFHPNCRHTISRYKDGDSLPKSIDNSEIEKRYKLEQKQRRLENEVRRAKRKAEGFSDPENVRKANRELREAQKKLREFINTVNEEEGKLILKRDYDREKIYSGDSVDFSGESGIIEEASKKPVTPITDSFIERVPKVEISGYTDEQCNFIQKQHKELLEYSRRNNDNNEVAFVFNSDLTNRREFTGADDRLDFGTSLYGKDLFVMHNHPRNSSYSDTDIAFLLSSDNIKALSIVKNNGFVEVLTKTNKFNKEALMIDFKRQYKKIVKTGSDAEIDKAVRKFIVNNKEGLEWKENK